MRPDICTRLLSTAAVEERSCKRDGSIYAPGKLVHWQCDFSHLGWPTQGPGGGVVRKTRFSEEQIIAILKEGEAGVEPGELCRRHGITRGSLYRWKAKYAAWRSARPSACGLWKRRTGD